MGSVTSLGLYKPDPTPPGERGWGALVDANWDLLNALILALQDPNAVTQIRTQPPITLSSPNALTVGTSAVALSSVAGGIPVGATHALISVAPPGSPGNPNGNAAVQPTVGNLYQTEDGSTVPNPATGLGGFIGAGLQDELTNLAQQKFISEVAGVKVTPMFRKYT